MLNRHELVDALKLQIGSAIWADEHYVDAIPLVWLKEIVELIEPRVLTWNEIVRSIEIESPSIWVEDRDKIHVIPALTIISCVTNSENATFVMRGKRVNVKHEDYNKRWRAWTAKPTPDQRLEVPWNE